jgi:hypothetical protein
MLGAMPKTAKTLRERAEELLQVPLEELLAPDVVHEFWIRDVRRFLLDVTDEPRPIAELLQVETDTNEGKLRCCGKPVHGPDSLAPVEIDQDPFSFHARDCKLDAQLAAAGLKTFRQREEARANLNFAQLSRGL